MASMARLVNFMFAPWSLEEGAVCASLESILVVESSNTDTFLVPTWYPREIQNEDIGCQVVKFNALILQDNKIKQSHENLAL